MLGGRLGRQEVRPEPSWPAEARPEAFLDASTPVQGRLGRQGARPQAV